MTVVAALAVLACGERAARTPESAATGSTDRVDLLGAGATFPFPLYARWFNQFAQDSGVRINYQSIGSGGGIRQLTAGTVDFGASDVPMSDAEIAEVPGERVVHLPTVLGAVAITYNLPELTRALRLSPDVVADIFLGRITRWNDPRLAALNPDQPLPDADILVVHRSDGSGTSYIVSDYLSRVSPDWAAGPGRSKDVRWPIGIGGKGNEGVAAQVKAMPGSIGYLEASYARQNRLRSAQLRNAAGNFVAPAAYEIALAASSALASIADTADLRVSIVNAPGDRAYPIASFTWMLVAPDLIGPARTDALKRFLRWALADGAEIARTLGYEPLPPEVAGPLLVSLDRRLPTPARDDVP
ncbi:MAG TPA: phosphate ABC transporter substrate-binding protein PstS [Gemmatimonadaceae bacterium]|nr:phosphate ABC transporter substrate-binding protein PstS [Gemmatimonadaceae bacterium]